MFFSFSSQLSTEHLRKWEGKSEVGAEWEGEMTEQVRSHRNLNHCSWPAPTPLRFIQATTCIQELDLMIESCCVCPKLQLVSQTTPVSYSQFKSQIQFSLGLRNKPEADLQIVISWNPSYFLWFICRVLLKALYNVFAFHANTIYYVVSHALWNKVIFATENNYLNSALVQELLSIDSLMKCIVCRLKWCTQIRFKIHE